MKIVPCSCYAEHDAYQYMGVSPQAQYVQTLFIILVINFFYWSLSEPLKLLYIKSSAYLLEFCSEKDGGTVGTPLILRKESKVCGEDDEQERRDTSHD